MTDRHPDFDEEQRYIHHAYSCLARLRRDALQMRSLTEAGVGGTHQNLFDRDAIDVILIKRLTELDLGDSALVFGRIDRAESAGESGGSGDDIVVEAFHIGRLAVSDENHDPVVVDWRAPVAEPFYRATGREPMGLLRRRHFVVEGSTLLDLEDELFGEGHIGVGDDSALGGDDGTVVHPSGLRGRSTLLAAIERGRTGRLGDIVATIQAEQDEIIRSPQAGVLIVQGGPGTGKTIVALHRAAYLMYTHRFPLEDQGVLVIGPNRVFLRYIERVLPSLGEAGIRQVVLQDLVRDVVPDIDFLSAEAPESARDSALAEKVKGDIRMVDVIDKAVSDRERPLRDDVEIPFRSSYLRLSAEESERIVKTARRRFRRHNAGRRYVENEVWEALAASWKRSEISATDLRREIANPGDVRLILEQMWPVLSPDEMLHDLFGSKALLRLAARGVLDDHEIDALLRPRSAATSDVRWTNADVALLDEAMVALGPRPNRKGRIDENDDIRTYGHIVVDEVQDLTPMQLRMVSRRSLGGSMTVVGDLAQATGSHAPATWDDVLEHLPAPRSGRMDAHRIAGLSVGYRMPGQITDLANRVLRVAAPELRPPKAVRAGNFPPDIVRTDDLYDEAARQVVSMIESVNGRSVAAVVPNDAVDEMSAALDRAGVEHSRAARNGLDAAVTVVPVGLVKGLEIDGVVVVEPSRIVAAELQGLRSLYVALTRATQRLTVVHSEPLPEAMN